MLQKFMGIFGGNPNKKEVERLALMIQPVAGLEAELEKLSDDALKAKTAQFRARLAAELAGIEDEKERQQIEQDVLTDLLPEAFAVVREASKRTLGLRHYDVQMIGGAALHLRNIAEMRTGEGKTLVGTLPVYLNALTGRGVHLITVNDYLSRRDARWMGPIYHALGMSVGVLQSAASTENGKKAFLFDPEKESAQEDKHQLALVDRRLAYHADITYGTNAEFGFDYLRDNMVYRPADKVQRGHYFAIIDEVDNILIDEARTPLIISGPAQGDLEYYGQMAAVVKQLNPDDYELNEKDRSISLTEGGTIHVEQLLGFPLRDPDRPEDVTPEQARYLGYLEQALRAQYLFKRNKDYLVQGGKVIIVDEFTGRLMAGRRWSDGLHQAVEAKEGVKVEPENVTYATITLQNYFRMYQKLAGMTGTALTEAEEFHKIYNLTVLPIPTNLEYNASEGDSPLQEIKSKDKDGYEIAYFARRDDPEKKPYFWRRTDYPDVIYRTVEAKLRAITQEIVHDHVIGRPILVGTTSVESSERLSGRLKAEPVRRLLQVVMLRDIWFQQSGKEEDGRLEPALEPLYKPLDQLDPNTLRAFAKPLDVSINPEDPDNLNRLLTLLRLQPEHKLRLLGVIQGGVNHQVLNARKHTEESQIIAGAGSFGAVTIATNMAGRGVDIKLGGELADEITAVISRLLRRAGYDPYNMRLEDQRQTILQLPEADHGIYASEVRFFLNYFDEMDTVRNVGGLHVIGSERHEARRIDNQLRGRAARQGDPGSSRFYLSLQDDLMRLFGGQQVDSIMQRFKLDDDYPMENRMVTGLIEQSQHRVEGANFDVRKHLLEYDDVLNKQRTIIYNQRDRVMDKPDLTEDISQFIETEVTNRVPAALQDEEGPWKLLAWLDQIQPPFLYGGGNLFPSFTHKVLLNELANNTSGDAAEAILDLVRRAIDLEDSHILKAIEGMVEHTSSALETQIDEKVEAFDAFLDGLKENDEPRKIAEVLEELRAAIQMDLRLGNDQQRALLNEPSSVAEAIREQIDTTLSANAITRLVNNLEFRLNERLELRGEELARLEWGEAATRVMAASQKTLLHRKEKLAGADGAVRKDLLNILNKVDPAKLNESGLISILNTISRGQRAVFNTKTHKQEVQEFSRLSYFYLASTLLEGLPAEELQDDILDHLQAANDALLTGWGQTDLAGAMLNAVPVIEMGVDATPLGIPEDARANSLTQDQQAGLVTLLGQKRLTEIHRNVLLGAVTEYWVEYLTRIEALRVSIGLEAYGQRDPLVMYKTKASEMFSTLLGEIRTATIDKVFRYLPRNITLDASQADASAVVSAGNAQPAQPAEMPDTKAGGRKRHKKK